MIFGVNKTGYVTTSSIMNTTKRIKTMVNTTLKRILFLFLTMPLILIAGDPSSPKTSHPTSTLSEDPPPCFTVERSRPEWLGSSTAVSDPPGDLAESKLPREFKLEQNFPNPFNPETKISFAVKEKCRVVLKVFNIMGREILTLIDQDYSPGFHHIILDAGPLPSGTYLYQIRMKDFHAVKKMILLE